MVCAVTNRGKINNEVIRRWGMGLTYRDIFVTDTKDKNCKMALMNQAPKPIGSHKRKS